MSILNNLKQSLQRSTSDLLSLLFPSVFPVCGEKMHSGEKLICNMCRSDMPLTNFEAREENAMEQRLWGLMPVVHATALFFYIEESRFRFLIHAIKFRGSWRTAILLGEWLGLILARTERFDEIDLIVPVPQHPLRRLQRGYNQSDYIARGVAKAMRRDIDCHSLRRHTYSRSQIKRPKIERWDNVFGAFRVRNGKAFQGRHILLVDDVFTTGSTICACADAILKAAPDARISVATIAVSHQEVGKYR